MTRQFSPELAALAFSLVLSLGLATFGVAQDSLSDGPGAVQHAMPPGGYIGTAALRTAAAVAPRGAVQHAMPPGGYVGTAAFRTTAAVAPRGAVQHAMPRGGYVGTAGQASTAMVAACPAQGGMPCTATVQD